jgi:pimeloyl-ACP methyl ester carboxylesterase
MRTTSLIPAALALIFAAACGDTTTGTPSPEAIETAESVARSVTIEAPPSTTPEADDPGDELVQLDGRVFGDGPRGVILSHMRTADQQSWFPFATTLAETGEYTVLTFDFRGYGESTSEKQFDRIDTDLEAAYEYMRDTLLMEDIYLIGASMGGTASLVVGARDDIAGVVSISSPAQFPPLDAVETVDEIVAPKLFISSEDDVPAMRSQELLWEAARAPKDEYVYEGDAHGTALFDTEHADDLERRLIDFLEAN